MNIGDKIRNARKASGMTQQQLAGERFTKGYISQVENGTVKPSMNVLTLIAERLDKPVTYFLEDDNYHKGIENKFISAENTYNMKKYGKALELFRELVDQTRLVGGVIHCNSVLNLGKCYYYLSEYRKATEFFEEGMTQLKELALYEKVVEANLYLGRCYFELVDYQKAIEYFEEGVIIGNKAPYSVASNKAKCLLNIATSYLRLGRLVKALDTFEETSLFCKQEPIIKTLLDCYVRMGYINYKLGNIALAKKYIVKANAINRIIECDMVWTEIFNVLGMIVFKEGSSYKAIKLLEKSMNISQKINYPWGYYVNIIDLISILLELRELEKVEGLLERYTEKIKGLQDKKIYNLLQYQEAKLYLLKDKIGRSISMYKSSIDLSIQLDIKWEVYRYSKVLADILVDVNPKEAKRYYNLSLEYLTEISK